MRRVGEVGGGGKGVRRGRYRISQENAGLAHASVTDKEYLQSLSHCCYVCVRKDLYQMVEVHRVHHLAVFSLYFKAAASLVMRLAPHTTAQQAHRPHIQHTHNTPQQQRVGRRLTLQISLPSVCCSCPSPTQDK